MLHVFDFLWELLQPRNMLETLRSLPYMGLITWRSLHRRWGQTLVTVVAVSLGFSAYLCLNVVFGASAASVSELIAEIKLPAPVVVRQSSGITAAQTDRLLKSPYIGNIQQAIELTAYLGTAETRIMGFAPEEEIWKQYVAVTAGSSELTSAGVALPEQVAGLLGASVGDKVRLVAHAGALGRLNRAELQVECIFTSEYALFDQPLALSNSAIFQGYDIKEPTLLLLRCRDSEVRRVINIVESELFVNMQTKPYAWLGESEYSEPWVSAAKQQYSILWQRENSNFQLDMAKSVLGNNYTTARKLVWLIYGFSALCVFSILLITLLTRRRDIGMLKSVGYDDIDIFTSFVLEAAFVSAGGVLLGIGVSQIAAVVLSRMTGYALSIGAMSVVKASVMSFFLYLLTAMIPADMARYTPTSDLLREGELYNRWREDPLVLSNPQLVDRNRLY